MSEQLYLGVCVSARVLYIGVARAEKSLDQLPLLDGRVHRR